MFSVYMLLLFLAFPLATVRSSESHPFTIDAKNWQATFSEFAMNVSVRDSPGGKITSQYFLLTPAWLGEFTAEGEEVFLLDCLSPNFVFNVSENISSTPDGGIIHEVILQTYFNETELSLTYYWFEKPTEIYFPFANFTHLINEDGFKFDVRFKNWKFRNESNIMRIRTRIHSSEPFVWHEGGGLMPFIPKNESFLINSILSTQGPIGGAINVTVLSFVELDGMYHQYKLAAFNFPGLESGEETPQAVRTLDNTIELPFFHEHMYFDPDFAIILTGSNNEAEEEEEDEYSGLGTGGMVALVVCAAVVVVVAVVVMLAGFCFYTQKRQEGALRDQSGGTVNF
ncbi:hypothetical protein QOT17_000743 [Balamuthia mandrillaris]